MQHIIERRIMWGDLDALGIVFYPRYSEWIDGCAHQFFEAVGIPHDRLWKDHGLVLGLAETQCRFMHAGRYHQTIRILTRLQDLNPRGLSLAHVITSASDDKIMVKGIEKRLCLDATDPENLKVVSLPEVIYKKLDQALTLTAQSL